MFRHPAATPAGICWTGGACRGHPARERVLGTRHPAAPTSSVPRKLPKSRLATEAQPQLSPLGPQIHLVQATWRKDQEVVCSSEGNLCGGGLGAPAAKAATGMSDWETQRRLAHTPGIFSGRTGLAPSGEGDCVFVPVTRESRRGSRERACRLGPSLPAQTVQLEAITAHILSRQRHKNSCPVLGGGQGTYVLQDEGFHWPGLWKSPNCLRHVALKATVWILATAGRGVDCARICYQAFNQGAANPDPSVGRMEKPHHRGWPVTRQGGIFNSRRPQGWTRVFWEWAFSQTGKEDLPAPAAACAQGPADERSWQPLVMKG